MSSNRVFQTVIRTLCVSITSAVLILSSACNNSNPTGPTQPPTAVLKADTVFAPEGVTPGPGQVAAVVVPSPPGLTIGSGTQLQSFPDGCLKILPNRFSPGLGSDFVSSTSGATIIGTLSLCKEVPDLMKQYGVTIKFRVVDAAGKDLGSNWITAIYSILPSESRQITLAGIGPPPHGFAGLGVGLWWGQDGDHNLNSNGVPASISPIFLIDWKCSSCS